MSTQKISGVEKRQKKAALEARSVLGQVVPALVLKEWCLRRRLAARAIFILWPLSHLNRPTTR